MRGPARRSPIRAAVMATMLLLLPFVSIASAQSRQDLSAGLSEFAIFQKESATSARALAGTAGLARGALLDIDQSALQALRSRGKGRVALQLPAIGNRTLNLRRFDLLASNAVTIQRRSGPASYIPEFTLFRGEVDGVSDSWVVLSMSREGVLGTIDMAGERFSVGPPRNLPSASYALVANERDLDQTHEPFQCSTEEAERTFQDLNTKSIPGPGVNTTTTRLVCNVAVECDSLYRSKFGSTLSSLVYAATVFGTVSLIFERDVNVDIVISSITIWETTDPYAASSTTVAKLSAFSSYWQSHYSGIGRTVAHLVTVAPTTGGGVSYAAFGSGALCSTSIGYGCTKIDATYSYPTNTTTWDVMAIAHELGHNFGSPHTQSCYWQSHGWASTGALLDSCWYDPNGPGDPDPDAPCYSGEDHIAPPGGGTLMSYCHQNTANSTYPDGIAGRIRLKFHPTCAALMRGVAEASCIGAATVQPPIAFGLSLSGTSVAASWTASSSSSVLYNEVHRSPTQLDLAAATIDTTSGTSYTDPASPAIGLRTLYYKVRAIRASDQSDYSGEAKIDVCIPAAPTFYAPSGGLLMPEKIVTGDFNEDGIPDLAVGALYFGSPSSSAIDVYIGQGSGGVGNGTFASAVAYSLGGPPQDLVKGDFNDDGITDLMTASDPYLRILLGLGTSGVGDGTFDSPATRTSLHFPRALALGDFNEDGITDVAVVGDAGGSNYANFGIHLGQGSSGTGNGTFAAVSSSATLGGTLRSVIARDFNEDGILDLAYAINDSSKVAVRLGNGSSGVGDGTFGSIVRYAVGTNPVKIATADFNEDGVTDLAVANQGSDNVSILLGNGSSGVGNGTFGSATNVAAGSNPNDLIAADWYQDGITDLAVISQDGDATAVMPESITFLAGQGSGNTGNGTFLTGGTYLTGEGSNSFQAGDFNEDGVVDMATAGTLAQTMGVRLGTCNGGLSNSMTVTPGTDWPIGSEHTISWSKGAGVTMVNVELSRDSGVNWETIGRNITDNSMVYTVTAPPSTHARVRVSDPYIPNHAVANSSNLVIYYPDDGFEAVDAPIALAGGFQNPIQGDVVLNFAVRNPGPVHVDLYNLAGRRVARQDLGSTASGMHQVTLARRNQLGAGVYFLRVVAGADVLTRKVVLID